MTKEEFALIKTYLESAYQSQRYEVSIPVWFDFLKDFNYFLAFTAIKKYVQVNKFPPTIADIVKGYHALLDDFSNLPLDDTILKMRDAGYFNTPFNEPTKVIDGRMFKANKWVYTGIMPSWFLRDYKKYKTAKIAGGEKLVLSK